MLDEAILRQFHTALDNQDNVTVNQLWANHSFLAEGFTGQYILPNTLDITKDVFSLENTKAVFSKAIMSRACSIAIEIITKHAEYKKWYAKQCKTIDELKECVLFFRLALKSGNGALVDILWNLSENVKKVYKENYCYNNIASLEIDFVYDFAYMLMFHYSQRRDFIQNRNYTIQFAILPQEVSLHLLRGVIAQDDHDFVSAFVENFTCIPSLERMLHTVNAHANQQTGSSSTKAKEIARVLSDRLHILKWVDTLPQTPTPLPVPQTPVFQMPPPQAPAQQTKKRQRRTKQSDNQSNLKQTRRRIQESQPAPNTIKVMQTEVPNELKQDGLNFASEKELNFRYDPNLRTIFSHLPVNIPPRNEFEVKNEVLIRFITAIRRDQLAYFGVRLRFEDYGRMHASRLFIEIIDEKIYKQAITFYHNYLSSIEKDSGMRAQQSATSTSSSAQADSRSTSLASESSQQGPAVSPSAHQRTSLLAHSIFMRPVSPATPNTAVPSTPNIAIPATRENERPETTQSLVPEEVPPSPSFDVDEVLSWLEMGSSPKPS